MTALLVACAMAASTSPVGDVAHAAVDAGAANVARSLRGQLIPLASVQLPARAAGVIEAFNAREGDLVKKGDLIVQLTADIERADLAHSEAALEAANVEWERTKREHDRQESLWKQQIGAEKEREDAAFAHRIAEFRRKQAQASVARSRAALNDRAIRAEFSGLVLRLSRSIGEAVDRHEPVVQLVDASKLELLVFGTPDLLGKFTVGQPTKLLLEDGLARGTTIVAKVSYVDPVMTWETKTFRIKMEVEPGPNVQAGFFVSVQLPSEVN